MPRATCRCGEILNFPAEGSERIVCPKCGARIRVRRAGPPRARDEGDGYIRFLCPCGRRLKVRIDEEPLESGKCPDCGRVVAIPSSQSSSQALPASHPESITEELSAADLATLERWKQDHLAKRPAPATATATETATAPGLATTATIPVTVPAPTADAPAAVKLEAGLRVCPRCGKPVHLSSIICRDCGAHVPKR